MTRDTFDSSERPAATASSTNTNTPPYQPRHHFGHPQAFVTDAYSRRIVDWQASRSLRSDLAVNALEQAIWERNQTGVSFDGLAHHSDRGGPIPVDPLHRTARRQRHRSRRWDPAATVATVRRLGLSSGRV